MNNTAGSGFKFALGATVKDKVTGYTGIVTGRSEWMYGCSRYNVKSKELKDGRPMDSVVFDEFALDLVEEPAESLDVIATRFRYELGGDAKDRLSGFEGKIAGRMQWLHGCNVYYLQSTARHQGKPIPAQGSDEDALEILKPAEPHKMRATGGPGGAERSAPVTSR